MISGDPPMKILRALLGLTLPIGLLSCSQPGIHYRPTSRLGGSVVDSVDTRIKTNSTIYGYSTNQNYSDIEVGIGASIFYGQERKGVAEVVFAQASYGAFDALEVALGGRYFLGSSSKFNPYASLHWVSSFFDQDRTVSSTIGPVGGIDAGTKGSLRAGVGAEYWVSDRFFLDGTLRYQFQVVDGNAVGGWVDNSISGVEVEGLSAFLGIGFLLGN
jgi:hypothetical protein